jgi:tRNA(Arg) A34 adenosine deaminase TadA
MEHFAAFENENASQSPAAAPRVADYASDPRAVHLGQSTLDGLEHPPSEVRLRLPDWVMAQGIVPWGRVFTSDNEKMALVIKLARLNVEKGTGGPFAAAVFDRTTGKIVHIGVSVVVGQNDCTAHGETTAFRMAGTRLGTWQLGRDRELFSSAEPCGMCLTATLWSGVGRLVTGATKEDAEAIGFDEGPVDERSYEHLRQAGVEVVKLLMRPEAASVLQEYAHSGGIRYNGDT